MLASLHPYRSSKSVTTGGNMRNPSGSTQVDIAKANTLYLLKKYIEWVPAGRAIQLANIPKK